MMKDEAHTPGPWSIEAGAIVASDNVIAVVGTIDIGSERQANAHLIAAAPDLLQACLAFLGAWEKSHQLEKTDVAKRMARQAVEKALFGGEV